MTNKTKKSTLMALLPLIKNSSRDKNISEYVVVRALNKAYESLARKKYGMDYIFESKFDNQEQDFSLYQYKKVVKTVNYENREISVEEAKKHSENVSEGEEIGFLVTDLEIKRSDVTFVKQVLMNEIRQAERGQLLDEFKNRVGKVVSGIVKRVDSKGNVFVDLGRSEYPAVLYKNQQLEGEDLYPGSKVEAFLLSVNARKDGPEVKLSRTSHLYFLKKLEEEFPELEDGTLEVVKVAREAGERTKIVIKSNDSSVDVMKILLKDNAFRLNQIRAELEDEKINIIEATNDEQELLQEVIKPGEVSQFLINEDSIDLVGTENEEDLGRLIGKRGSNLKLIASIMGKKVNVISKGKLKQKINNDIEELKQVEGVSDVEAHSLVQVDVLSIPELSKASNEVLEPIFNTKEKVQEVQGNAKKLASSGDYKKSEPVEYVESYSFPKNYVLPKRETKSSTHDAEIRLREELKSFNLK